MADVWQLPMSHDGEDVEAVADILNGKRQKQIVMEVALVSGLAYSAERKNAIYDSCRDRLRALVDQWIDSGRAGRGDSPSARNVEWVSEKYPRPLNAALHDLWSFNTLLGRSDLKTGIPSAVLDVRKSRRFNGSELSVASWTGVAWFQRLLASHSKLRLSRCDHCALYFVRARTPRANIVIARGAYCPDHMNMGGAARSRQSRDVLNQAMVDFAAFKRPEYRPSYRTGDEMTWLAAKVSEKFEKRLKAPVTKKWVVQNWAKIEDMGRGVHAKG